jgi:predicted Zn-ribbon and HTH transcriptional regulator
MHLRPNLHLIAEHRSRRRRAALRGPIRLRDSPDTPAVPREPQAVLSEPQAAAQVCREDLQRPDIALKRVRESGGPLDHASYACQCGYIFEADVSTTVSCPHCHVAQAW